MPDCIFCKIRDRKLPAKFAYEDEEIMVFPDINPIKKVHLLIVPKKHIVDFLDVSDNLFFGRILSIAQKLVKEKELENKGYRLLINSGGAQIIDHLHIHLVGPLGKHVKLF